MKYNNNINSQLYLDKRDAKPFTRVQNSISWQVGITWCVSTDTESYLPGLGVREFLRYKWRTSSSNYHKAEFLPQDDNE